MTRIEGEHVEEFAKVLGHNLRVIIYAEDVDSLGTYRPVQGQYNDSSQFVLLTNGTSTPTVSTAILMEDGSNQLLMEDGSNIILMEG